MKEQDQSAFKRIVKIKTILLISAALLIIISIAQYMGKFSNMIARYNTMRLNEKAKYDELKICRVLAIALSARALILILELIDIMSFKDKLIISIVVLIIGSI